MDVDHCRNKVTAVVARTWSKSAKRASLVVPSSTIRGVRSYQAADQPVSTPNGRDILLCFSFPSTRPLTFRNSNYLQFHIAGSADYWSWRRALVLSSASEPSQGLVRAPNGQDRSVANLLVPNLGAPYSEHFSLGPKATRDDRACSPFTRLVADHTDHTHASPKRDALTCATLSSHP